MARRSLFFVLTLVAVAAAASLATAGIISAKRGVVEKISHDGKTVTVKFARAEETTELSVAGEIDVLLDGKHVDLKSIKPGMSVTVQVDGTVAQRIIAHAASDAESKPKATTASKPKTTASKSTGSKSTAKASTTRKSKQVARKSTKSSRKKNEPNALDELPVATTPLAALGTGPSEKKNEPSALDALPTAQTPLSGAKAPSRAKSNQPNALDGLPVATTPLAGDKNP